MHWQSDCLLFGSSKRVVTKRSCLHGSGAELSTQPLFRECISKQLAMMNFNKAHLRALTQVVATTMMQMGFVPGQGGDGGQGGAGGGRDHGPRRKIDTKMMRIRDFSCEMAHWEAWVHSFKSAIRSTCPAALQTMEEVEKSSYDGTDDNLDAVEDVGKISRELYDILSPSTSPGRR